MTEPTSGRPRTSRRWPWISAVPVALAAGFALGFTVQPEPETTTIQVPTAATVQEREAMDNRAATLDQHWREYQKQYDALNDREAELSQRTSELDERQSSLDARESDISQQEEILAQSTVTDGVWVVGVDIEPGTYRASGVPSDCYWSITATGSNGGEIIENDIPGGGNPAVTLDEGQDFTSSRCGEWHLQQQ